MGQQQQRLLFNNAKRCHKHTSVPCRDWECLCIEIKQEPEFGKENLLHLVKQHLDLCHTGHVRFSNHCWPGPQKCWFLCYLLTSHCWYGCSPVCCFKGSIRYRLTHSATSLIFPKAQFYFLKCLNIARPGSPTAQEIKQVSMFLLFSQGDIFARGSLNKCRRPLHPSAPPETLGDSANPTVNDTTSWDVMGVGAAAVSCRAGTRTYRNVGRLQRASLSSQRGLGTREEIRDALSSSTHSSR